MPKKTKSPAAASANQKPCFKGLLHIQFHLVARLSERQAEKDHQKVFGMPLSEMKIIALVGSQGTLPFRALTEDGFFEKGHASRMVSSLVRRGLVRDRLNPEDKRANILRLTPKGEAVYARSAAFAARNDQRWLDVLSKKQHAGCADENAVRKKGGIDWQEGKACRPSSPLRSGVVPPAPPGRASEPRAPVILEQSDRS
jgi:DNA-binding MarR family transcriptional regulator